MVHSQVFLLIFLPCTTIRHAGDPNGVYYDHDPGCPVDHGHYHHFPCRNPSLGLGRVKNKFSSNFPHINHCLSEATSLIQTNQLFVVEKFRRGCAYPLWMDGEVPTYLGTELGSQLPNSPFCPLSCCNLLKS